MNENKVHSILNASPVGFAYHEIIIDHESNLKDYRFIDINPAFEKITGLKKEIIIGNTVRNSFHISGSIGIVWLNLYEKITKGDESVEFEYYVADLAKWFMISAYLTDSTHFAITLTDITLSKQSPTAKQTKKAQQLPFWDNNLFGLLIADKNGNYVEANEEVCRMTGYSCQELKNMNLFNLADPEKADEARIHFENLKDSGRSYGEIVYYTKEGEKRWWNVVATQLSEDYFLGLHEDITSRKLAEEQLREEKEHHAEVISNISDIIWEYEVDSQGQFVGSYISTVADRMLGLPSGTIGHEFQNYFKYVHPDDIQRVLNTFSYSLFSEEKKLHRIEYRLCLNNGNEKYVRTSGIVYLKPNGNRVAYGNTSDITELKKKEDDLSKVSANLTAIVENTGDSIWAINTKYEIIYLNENFRRAYFATFNTELKQGSHKLQSLPKDMVQVWKERYDKVLAGERIEFTDSVEMPGLTVYVEVSGNPIFQEGIVIGASFFGKDITARKIMEEKLSHNVELNKKLLTTIPDVVIQTNLEGIITYVNEQGLINYPWITSEQLLGNNLLSFIAPHDHSRIKENFRLMFEKPLGIKEYTLCFGDGLEIYCEANGEVIRDSKGNPLSMVFVIRDITERKRAEEKLKENQLLLESALDMAKMANWEFDIKTGIFTFNDRFYALYGTSVEAEGGYEMPAEVYAREFVHPDDSYLVKAEIDVALSTDDPLFSKEIEHRIIRRDGEIRTILVRYGVKLDSSNNVVMTHGANQDITERKRAEEALHQSEERLDLAMAVKNEGVWDWNLVTNEAFFDERYYSMAGYSPNEFPNSFEGWKEKLHPDDLSGAEAAIKAYLAGEREHFDIEFRFKCKDGSWMWIQGRGKVVERNEAGVPLRIIGTHTDITERKRAEDALQSERDQLLSVFNSIDQAVYIADTETYELLYVNQSLSDLLDNNLVGTKCYKALQGLDSPCHFCTNNNIIKQKSKPYIWEFYNQKVDRYFDIVDRIIRWPDGRDVRFEMAVDITERKRAENTLHQNEERLQKQNDALLLLMSRGTLFKSELKKAITEITEVSAALIDTDRVSVWLYNEDYSEIKCLDLFNRNSNNHVSGEKLNSDEFPAYTSRHKTGKVIAAMDVFTDSRTSGIPASYFKENNIYSLLDVPVWMHDRLGALLSFEHVGEQRQWTAEDERVATNMAALLSLCFQNDYRKKVEEDLLQNRNMLDTILNTIPQSVFWKDKDCNYLGCNVHFANAVGLKKPDDIIGKTDYDLPWPKEEAEAYRKDDRFVMDNNLSKSHIIEPLQQADGSRIWIDTTKIPLLDGDSKVSGVLGVYEDITERKESEEELEKIKIQLKETIMQSPLPMVLASAEDFKLKIINKATEDFLLIKSEDYIEKSLLEVDIVWQEYTPDGNKVEPFELPLPRALQGLETSSKEMRIERRDGSSVWELASGAPIFDSKGNLIAGLLIMYDITKRKQAEEALRESEERFKSLHNASFGGIAIHDKGIILECNLGLSEMTGYSLSELIGMNGLLLISEKTRADVISKIASGYEKPYEAIGLRKNGEEYQMRLEARNVQYKGKPVRTVEFRDITEIKRTEIEIIKAKEKAEENNKVNIARLKLIQFSENHNVDEILEETLNEAEKVLDSKIGFFHFINEDQATLTLQNWSTQTKANFCKAKGKGEHYPIEKAGVWVDCVHTHKPVIHNNYEELPHKKGLPEGHAAIIRELTVPIIYDNKLKAIIGVGNKETDYDQNDVENLTLIAYLAWEIIEKRKAFEALQIAKEKAEESDRLKSAFLANMSHEIRTPMNGILGFADLLKEPELSGDDQRRYIEIIEKSGRRMLNIINDIIDISKIEAGLMELRMTESDITEQIDYIYVFFKPEAEAKGLKISVNNSLSDNDSILITDREKLYAILTNLVKNAIKYTEKGDIEIGCNHKGNYIEFYVKDTGIGIPEDRQKVVFERFIQADIEDKMALQGAGLGLAITKAYIEMMGGRIWLESEVGKGSVFFFTLPLAKNADKKEVVETEIIPENTKNPVSQLSILIVEDDETSEILLEIELKKIGKKIIKAKTGLDAVETLKTNQDIDLVLMDIRLPKMDGYEATRQIRMFNKDVIIIAQTAYGLSGDRERAIESGCNDYLAKPIDVSELYSLLHKYFEK